MTANDPNNPTSPANANTAPAAGTPAAGTPAAGMTAPGMPSGGAGPEATPGGAEKRDLLKTPPAEARELEIFVRKGASAHARVGCLTLLAIGVFFLGLLYYNRLDIGKQGEAYVSYPNKILDHKVVQAHEAMTESFQLRNGMSAPARPAWPLAMYYKLRRDIFIVTGLFFVLGMLFVLMETARMRRNDLLIYRSMAREIEKLRLRTRQLQKQIRKQSGEPEETTADASEANAPSTGATGAPPSQQGPEASA